MTSDKARPSIETSVVQIAGRALLGTVIGTAAAWGIWFGYAHTEPRFHWEIFDRADVILTIAVLVVGALASELAHARRRLRDDESAR